jgi:hypothetical protein
VIRAIFGEPELSDAAETLAVMSAPVKFYVDAWDPSYGSGLDLPESGPTGESTAQLAVDVELPAGSWRPLAPAPDMRAPRVVLLVDGVRRVDARVWVEEPDGTLHLGLAASYAAGVVRCDLRQGSAEVAAALVERGLFTQCPAADGLTAANARYPVRRAVATEAVQLSAAVQARLHELEERVSVQTRGEDDLLVVDGPLRGRAQLERVLGYVKTHRVQYLPTELTTVVGQLRPGQRCPVFLLGTSWHRYTWYLKLPGPAGSPWAGVVRVEAAADLSRSEAIRLADLSAVTLPRFASTPYKDARAPQNLTPIAGLERRLRGMLGDSRLLLRGLTAAARRPAA